MVVNCCLAANELFDRASSCGGFSASAANLTFRLSFDVFLLKWSVSETVAERRHVLVVFMC